MSITLILDTFNTTKTVPLAPCRESSSVCSSAAEFVASMITLSSEYLM